MNWNTLVGKKVSILIVGKEDKTENYMGIVSSVEDDFLTLDTNNPTFNIETIIFRTDLIKSV